MTLNTDETDRPPALSDVNLDTIDWGSSGSSVQWNWKVPEGGSGPTTDVFGNLDDIINDVETSLNAQFYRDFPDDEVEQEADDEPGEESSGGLPSWLVPAALAAVIIVAVGGFFLVKSGGGGEKASAGAAPAQPSATAAQAAAAKYTCAGGDAIQLFNNSNADGVENGGTPPSFSTNGKAYCLDQIQTYHWNGGYGMPPGQIGLQGAAGMAGPFQAQGSAGQAGVLANWYVYPPNSPPIILNGSYTCIDSSTATWSSNKGSGGMGFCQVWVLPRESSRLTGRPAPRAGTREGGWWQAAGQPV